MSASRSISWSTRESCSSTSGLRHGSISCSLPQTHSMISAMIRVESPASIKRRIRRTVAGAYAPLTPRAPGGRGGARGARSPWG
ncbi:hypothetical protein, partial [Streptomyces sp. N35]|uniref:hypothetical protein n=1 Tax=Streptomyces sp. N35 TaxID=2795730 RepID=UPI001F15B6CE